MTVKYGDNGRMNKSTTYGTLIASYVHSGNRVIQPTALDKTTGIWTTAQSLNALIGASGTIVANLAIVPTSFTANILPREFVTGSAHRLEVISDTTFYIQDGTTRLTSYLNGGSASVDVTKFSFDLTNIVGVTAANLIGYNMKEIYVRSSGWRCRPGQSYINLLGNSDAGAYTTGGLALIDGKDSMYLNQDMYFKYDSSNSVLLTQGGSIATATWTDTNGLWTYASSNSGSVRTIEMLTNFKFTGVYIGFGCANNFTVDVYDIRGV